MAFSFIDFHYIIYLLQWGCINFYIYHQVWFYWLVLASFWLLFWLLPWFGFVSAWWEVSEWWTYHVFRHVAICVLSDWLPIIIWALRHCSGIFSRAGESSECARPNPQWELKGAPHNAALPGASRRFWGVLSWRGGEKGPLHLRLQLIIMVDPGGGHMVTKRLL